MKFTLCKRCIALVAIILFPGQGLAALVSYTSESDFLAASNQVSVESFESFQPSGLISSLVSPLFTITHNDFFRVLDTPSVHDTQAADGVTYLEERSGITFVNSMVFSGFDAPLTAFGFFVSDYGDFGTRPLVMTVNDTNMFTIASPPRTSGNQLYFGVVATNTDRIHTVELASDDAIGIDKVSISAIVPEPTTGSFFCWAIAIVSAVGRRSRTKR